MRTSACNAAVCIRIVSRAARLSSRSVCCWHTDTQTHRHAERERYRHRCTHAQTQTQTQTHTYSPPPRSRSSSSFSLLFGLGNEVFRSPSSCALTLECVEWVVRSLSVSLVHLGVRAGHAVPRHCCTTNETTRGERGRVSEWVSASGGWHHSNSNSSHSTPYRLFAHTRPQCGHVKSAFARFGAESARKAQIGMWGGGG